MGGWLGVATLHCRETIQPSTFRATITERKLQRVSTICVILWCLTSAAYLDAQQYIFHAYQQAEGLKNLAVNALARDREGYLWVATENGVYRFLGSRFQQFGREQGLAELDIRTVVADPAGTVWVTTDQNMYRWDGERFIPAMQQSIHMSGPQSIAMQDASHLVAVEDAHDLLIVVQHRLFRFEHDNDGHALSYRPVFNDHDVAANPALGNVFSVSVIGASSKSSQVWIGCGGRLYSWSDSGAGGSSKPRDGAVTAWGKDRDLPEDDWQTVLLARNGVLWAGGQKHVVALPAGSSHFIDRSIPGSDAESVYGHAPLIEDRDGRILSPTEDGITRWNGTGWQSIGRTNGLIHNSHITSMEIDPAGDLWLGSKGDGLYNWTGYEGWTGWSNVQGLPGASVWSIVPGRADRVYVGTDKGPAWIDPRTGLSGPLNSGSRWTFGQVGSMGFDRDGSLWAATFSGAILRMDPDTGRTVETAKLAAIITVGIQDSAGRLLLGSDHGIFEREPGSHDAPQRILEADKLLGGYFTPQAATEAPDGAIWFLIDNRLLREKNGEWTAPAIVGLPKLGGSLVAFSFAPDGTLWIAGDQDGVWRLTAKGGSLQASQLQSSPELRSSEPLAILADRNGWVWVGTDAGLSVWNGQSWRHLTEETGLIWNDVNQNALRAFPDGSLWIGTSGGVARLLHPERVFDPVPLAVSISDIRHGNDSFVASQQVTLPWPGTPLHFLVTTPTTRNRSELNLKIWMVGLQKNWVDDENGVATFTSLQPGDYTFMAMACNPAFQQCSGVVKVKVTIRPPWWRTNWFYVACALGLLLLLLTADQFRARSLRQTRQNLERLVSERTQELEASREQLRIQATYDGQTGMLNRAAVLRMLVAEMERARRENRTLVLAMADLDHFKRVNDVYGHLAGDEALRCFAAAVNTALRPYDHTGRFGGEEFLFVLPEIPLGKVEQRLKSLHASVSNLEVRTEQTSFTVTCSIGATIYDPSMGVEKKESLLAIADQALYAAKASGRNRVVYRDPRAVS